MIYMAWNNWNIRLSALLVTLLLTVVGFNYFLDPYGVFETRWLARDSYNVNERYLKVEHILQEPGRYDSFFLGDSAMDVFDSRTADRLRPGQHWYNLSFLGGNAGEALAVLRAIKQNGVSIREVIFGVDMIPYWENRGNVSGFLRMHPAVTGESRVSFLVRSLFASSFLEGINRIEHALLQKPTVVYDISATGRLMLLRYEREIASDPEAFRRRQFRGDAKIQGNDIVWIEQRFRELAELKAWLEEHHIAAQFFIQPYHHETRAWVSPRSYQEFCGRIVKILGEVPNFSLASEITDDDRNYYDPKHFRPEVSDLIQRHLLN